MWSSCFCVSTCINSSLNCFSYLSYKDNSCGRQPVHHQCHIVKHLVSGEDVADSFLFILFLAGFQRQTFGTYADNRKEMFMFFCCFETTVWQTACWAPCKQGSYVTCLLGILVQTLSKSLQSLPHYLSWQQHWIYLYTDKVIKWLYHTSVM